jgi:hypothetical protein
LNSSKTSCSGRTKKGRSQTKTSGFYILVQDNLDAAGYKLGSGNVFEEIEAAASANVSGCTDPTAFNYDATANTDDGSCVAVVSGCTDATAFNYDATANTDDGSCVAATYAIGDNAHGGYVYYVESDGKAGMVVADAQWNNKSWEWSVNKCNTFSRTIDGITYDDWALPNIGALEMIRDAQIGNFFESSWRAYWSDWDNGASTYFAVLNGDGQTLWYNNNSSGTTTCTRTFNIR